ncbi:MAG: hypothetical protein AAGH64_02755, partial [Planctomycetota bacterium]
MNLRITTLGLVSLAALASAQSVNVAVQGPTTANPGETVTVSVVATVTGLAGTGAIAGYGLDLDAIAGASSIASISGATSGTPFQTGVLAGTPGASSLERAVGGQLPAANGLNMSVDQSTTVTLFTADITLDAGATGTVTLRAGVSDVSGGVILYPDIDSGANIIAPAAAGTSISFTDLVIDTEDLANACAGDFDGDGDVDLGDFGVFGAAFGSFAGDANYDAGSDFDDDGDVDLGDFGVFGSEFG